MKAIIKIYYYLVKRGLKTIEEIPSVYQKEVAELLERGE